MRSVGTAPAEGDKLLVIFHGEAPAARDRFTPREPQSTALGTDLRLTRDTPLATRSSTLVRAFAVRPGVPNQRDGQGAGDQQPAGAGDHEDDSAEVTLRASPPRTYDKPAARPTARTHCRRPGLASWAGRRAAGSGDGDVHRGDADPRTVCSAKATAIAQAKPVKRLPALLTAKPMISSGTAGTRTREADSTANPARRPSPTRRAEPGLGAGSAEHVAGQEYERDIIDTVEGNGADKPKCNDLEQRCRPDEGKPGSSRDQESGGLHLVLSAGRQHRQRADQQRGMPKTVAVTSRAVRTSRADSRAAARTGRVSRPG